MSAEPAPSRSESADDGCPELRAAIRTAFPQLSDHEVEHLVCLGRSMNDCGPDRAAA